MCPYCGSLMVVKEEDADKKVYECPNCGIVHVHLKIFQDEIKVEEYR